MSSCNTAAHNWHITWPYKVSSWIHKHTHTYTLWIWDLVVYITEVVAENSIVQNKNKVPLSQLVSLGSYFSPATPAIVSEVLFREALRSLRVCPYGSFGASLHLSKMLWDSAE